MPDIKAPFTPEQVERLNRYQAAGYNHPYTCGHDRRSEQHLDGEGVLMATTEGWTCPYCDYTQQGASGSMAEGPGPVPVGSLADNLCGEDARNDPEYVANLLAAFPAEGGRFRAVVLRLIAEARRPEALGLLLEQRQSPDPWLRYWAVKGLEWLNASEGHEVL